LSDNGAVVLEYLQVLGGAPGGVVTLPRFTAEARTDYGSATMEVMTALATQEGVDASGGVTLPQFVSSGVATSGDAAIGAVTLEQFTAFAASTFPVELTLSPFTASAVGLAGTVGSASVQLQPFQALAGASLPANDAVGTAVMQAMTSTGLSYVDGMAVGAASLRLLQVSAVAISGTVGLAAPSLQRLTIAAVGAQAGVAAGAASMPMFRATGFNDPTLASTYRTWVMNVANEGLTEYTNYSYNSFAVLGGRNYAAGPDGIYELVGATDDGDAINWTVRTGLMDDKNANLKRLHEVLLAMRYNGPIRVRVWTDNVNYYDYTLSNYRAELHQVRAKLGKGLKSRYFRIELIGLNGSTAEIDSMQVPMTPVSRRIG
jgi:hypothetical protein